MPQGFRCHPGARGQALAVSGATGCLPCGHYHEACWQTGPVGSMKQGNACRTTPPCEPQSPPSAYFFWAWTAAENCVITHRDHSNDTGNTAIRAAAPSSSHR